MNVIAVDDPSDPRLADYQDLRSRARNADDGYFVVEGVFAVERLLTSSYRVRSLLVARERLDRLPVVEADVFVAPLSVLRSVVGFDFHRGVLGAADRPAPAALSVLAGARRVGVLEGLTDLENLGLVFRSAAALFVDGIVLSPNCADPLSRRVVRVSVGHVLHVPFVRAQMWPSALEELRAIGFTVVAMTPSSDAEPLATTDLADMERLAVLVGAEGPGLTPGALAAADRRTRIEMVDGVDSLNVAVAASIAFDRLRPR